MVSYLDLVFFMARVTVEDCLHHVENRFELVLVSTKRARQLAIGGKQPMVTEDNDKPTVLALREIAEGSITSSILEESTDAEFMDEQEEIEVDALPFPT